MRISAWSSDVCSSDLFGTAQPRRAWAGGTLRRLAATRCRDLDAAVGYPAAGQRRAQGGATGVLAVPGLGGAGRRHRDRRCGGAGSRTQLDLGAGLRTALRRARTADRGRGARAHRQSDRRDGARRRAADLGNVGPATVDTLHVDVTAPLDRMGLAGGLLTAIRSVAHSRTTDPVTGQRRPVSSTPSSASLSARQDLGQGSWGAMLTGGLESTFYGVRPGPRMRSDPSADR